MRLGSRRYKGGGGEGGLKEAWWRGICRMDWWGREGDREPVESGLFIGQAPLGHCPEVYGDTVDLTPLGSRYPSQVQSRW